MNEQEYNAIEAIRFSRLKAIDVSPLHYHAQQRRDSGAMLLGRAVHCAVLEPRKFAERFAIYEGAVRRGKAWDEFRASHPDSEVLTSAECDNASRIGAAVRESYAAGLLDSIDFVELPFSWIDPDTQLRCKCRPDAVTKERVLLDLKTCRDPSPRGFGRQAAQFHYHAQMAFYKAGLVANGVHPARVVLIAAQSVEPYDVAVYGLTAEHLAAGHALCAKWLDMVEECTERNVWPGVAAGEVLDLDLPNWAMGDEDPELLNVGEEAA
jgi:hypothetical protein